ncbi:MAG: bifunctional hydroxymethylpyrimidine kinase/phosphomethylpyrimidine kinase [Proteobacteria bacterium]|nr:bifunctional hydroxymethylpyrimidine kinase/phosphomethylpyrimidine kinase [Pseudomonadota bacterium]
MPLALILSSYVAGSRVGGMAQALALAPFKIDPVVAPTTLFGRHPGWGPPGGAAVDAQTFKGVIDGLAANAHLVMADAILTGYFASAEQVWIAAETIDRARAARRPDDPPLRVIVDPVMGDQDKGLYVREEVAEAVALDLVSRADVITPNLWELNRLTGGRARDARSALKTARQLDRPCLVTSVPAGEGEIGVLYVDRRTSTFAVHREFDAVPRGTGDLLTALFAAGLIEKKAPHEALFRAVQGVAEAAEASAEWLAHELPIVALGERLVRPTASVRIETLS